MRVFVDYLISHLPTHLLAHPIPKDMEYDHVLQYICEELGVFACISEGSQVMMSYGIAEFVNKNFHLGQEKLIPIIKILRIRDYYLRSYNTYHYQKKYQFIFLQSIS